MPTSGVFKLHPTIETSTAKNKIVNSLEHGEIWERVHFQSAFLFVYVVFVCGTCASHGANVRGQQVGAFPHVSIGN